MQYYSANNRRQNKRKIRLILLYTASIIIITCILLAVQISTASDGGIPLQSTDNSPKNSEKMENKPAKSPNDQNKKTDDVKDTTNQENTNAQNTGTENKQLSYQNNKKQADNFLINQEKEHLTFLISSIKNNIQDNIPVAIKNNNPPPKTDPQDIIYDQYIVKESAPVANSYFDDAVFIGDSRTEGLRLYTNLNKTTFYTSNGMTVDGVFNKKVIKNKDGSKITIIDALKKNKFQKIYIMLGINELGWAYSDIFSEKYGKLIQEIEKIQPHAIIYVQSIMPVTAKKSQNDTVINNKKIHQYNTLLKELVKKYDLHYVNVGQAVADEKGNLPEETGMDGIHLNKTYCLKWLDYLKTHTVKD